MNKKLLISIIVVLLLTLLAIDDVIGDWSDINGSFENLYIFFTEDLFPPDWSILSAEPNLQCNSEIGFFCSTSMERYLRNYPDGLYCHRYWIHYIAANSIFSGKQPLPTASCNGSEGCFSRAQKSS